MMIFLSYVVASALYCYFSLPRHAVNLRTILISVLLGWVMLPMALLITQVSQAVKRMNR
jgi:hypothetical protein